MTRPSLLRLACCCVVLLASATLTPARPFARAQAPLVLKVGSVAPSGSPSADMMHTFGAHARDVSGNQFEVRIFPDGSLGDEARMLERTREGSLQACVVSLEALARQLPAAGVLLAPNLMRNLDYADRRLDGPVRKALATELESLGLVFGAWGPSELRGWLSQGPAIINANAARGLGHPAPRSAAEALVANALGATPLSVVLGAPGARLAAGGVQLVSVTPLEAVAAGLERGAQHFTASQHSLQGSVLLYSKQWLEGLPEDPRRGLAELPASITQDARKALRALRPAMLEVLRARGVRVVEPTPAQRRTAARPLGSVAPALARDAGPAGQQMLRAVRGR